MGALVMVMVDALRHDYLGPEDTPWLTDLAGEGSRFDLVPPFGFEPDEAIFAGLSPAEGEGGAQFWLDPERSPYRFVRPTLGAALDWLPAPARLAARALLMQIARRSGETRRVRDHPTTARIPFKYLHLFDFVQKRYPYEEGYGKGRSLFKIAARNGVRWFYHGFPQNDVTVEAVLKSAHDRVDADHGFVFMHIGDLDAIGHRYGPHSPPLRAALRRVDNALARLIEILNHKLGPVHSIIFGDHGMSSVHTHLDVWSKLSNSGIRLGEDVLMFLDSTLVRIWLKRAAAEKQVREALAPVLGLRLLDESDRIDLSIQWTHDKFGHLIYQAEEGYIVHPSFYADRVAPLGMHGYGPDASQDRAALILSPEMGPIVDGANLPASPSGISMSSVYHLAVRALECLD